MANRLKTSVAAIRDTPFKYNTGVINVSELMASRLMKLYWDDNLSLHYWQTITSQRIRCTDTFYCNGQVNPKRSLSSSTKKSIHLSFSVMKQIDEMFILVECLTLWLYFSSPNLPEPQHQPQLSATPAWLQTYVSRPHMSMLLAALLFFNL